MISSRTRKTAGKLCVVFIFALVLVLIPALGFDFYYDLNDDMAIRDILSGAYTGTPDGHCIQMLFPLSWLIACCYTAVPALPWYGLFLCICQFGTITLIAWRLLDIFPNKLSGVTAVVVLEVIVSGLFMRQLAIVQYSVTAGICMSGACFAFVTEKKSGSFFLPAFLTVMAFMIRSEVCLMLFPFLMLAVLIKWGMEEKILSAENFRKYLIPAGYLLLVMAAVRGIDRAAYGSGEWNSFRSLFDARTKIYDFYGLAQYDEGNNEAFYTSIGLSRESYGLLENYNFSLDESIDSRVLNSIAEYREAQAKAGGDLSYTFGFVSRNTFKEALWLYKEQLISVFSDDKNAAGLSGSVMCSYAVAAAYVIYILFCFIPQSGRVKRHMLFKILGLVLIRSVLWLYLYMVDRVLDRVFVPILMTELAMLAGFILTDIKGVPFFRNAANAVVCILCVLFMGAAFVNNYRALSLEYDARERAGERWEALTDYCKYHNNNYYIIDVYSSTSYEGAPYSEKIFTDVDNDYKNYDICGGWVAKSPLYRQKLDREGFKDIQSALYSEQSEDTRAYFISDCKRDIQWLKDYYAGCGITVLPKSVDIITTDSGDAAYTVYAVN